MKTAQADYTREFDKLSAVLAQEPADQLVVDNNPPYATWVQQIGAERTTLEGARWDQLFDADVAVLRAAAASASAAWQQALENVDGLALRLDKQPGLEGPLAIQVAGLTTAVESAQQDAKTTADALQTAKERGFF